MISFFRVVDICIVFFNIDIANEGCTLAHTLFSTVAKICRAAGAGTELKLIAGPAAAQHH
jgi:hypothetical protein